MTLKECYKAIGGDYEGVVSRLVTEARVNNSSPCFYRMPVLKSSATLWK